MEKKKTDEQRRELIGGKLKKLRLKADFNSAEDFANKNDLNRVQYWRMEKGANFTIQSLLKVLNIHEITLEEFFKGLK